MRCVAVPQPASKDTSGPALYCTEQNNQANHQNKCHPPPPYLLSCVKKRCACSSSASAMLSCARRAGSEAPGAPAPPCFAFSWCCFSVRTAYSCAQSTQHAANARTWLGHLPACLPACLMERPGREGTGGLSLTGKIEQRPSANQVGAAAAAAPIQSNTGVPLGCPGGW